MATERRVKDFHKDWARLLAHAMDNADRIGLCAWRVLVGTAVLVLALGAGPEAARVLVWALLRVPGVAP